MDLISIIIPYYKKKKFIKKTLDSIKRQTYKKFEIIIIYDDENLEELYFLKSLCKNKKNIKILVNKKNYGAGYSRNLGIKKAKGKFIAFIDADDFWKSNKLSIQLKFMIKNKVNFTHTSYYVINKKKIISTRFARNFCDYKALLSSCDIGLSTVMLKRDLLKNTLFPELKTKEDFVLWLRLLKKENKIIAINQPLSFWREVDNSLSSNILQKLLDGYQVYRLYMKMSILKSFYYLISLSFNSLKK